MFMREKTSSKAVSNTGAGTPGGLQHNQAKLIFRKLHPTTHFSTPHSN